MMNKFSLTVSAVLILAGLATAQDRVKIETGQTWTQVEPGRIALPKEPGTMGLMQTWERLPEGRVAMFSADMAGGGEVVKNAPYTATVVTESTQKLADGNRIVNKSSAFVARDSQGRTRREQTFDRLGALNLEGNKVVFISDPTSRTDYVVDPGEKQARIVKRDNMKIFVMDGADNAKHETAGTIEMRSFRKERLKEVDNQAATETSKQVKHEALGTQVIEGVNAEGTRETVTIAAGQIGNDRPIDIVSENWYSADLHTVVMRKHSDPRFGETTFRLTDINRAEPDPSLFQVPAGFKTSTTAEPVMRALPRQKLPRD